MRMKVSNNDDDDERRVERVRVCVRARVPLAENREPSFESVVRRQKLN